MLEEPLSVPSAYTKVLYNGVQAASYTGVGVVFLIEGADRGVLIFTATVLGGVGGILKHQGV